LWRLVSYGLGLCYGDWNSEQRTTPWSFAVNTIDLKIMKTIRKIGRIHHYTASGRKQVV